MATKRKKTISTYGVYFVQGFSSEDPLDYGGVLAGESFPELTNEDVRDGEAQEDFLGAWLARPSDYYLQRAISARPVLRIVFAELSQKLPFGRKGVDEPVPPWVESAYDWGKQKLDGIELGVDVVEPGVLASSPLKNHLFERPLPELAEFRDRLNAHGLFSTFEDAAAFIEAAQKLNVRAAEPWRANRVYWLRSVERVTTPLWQPEEAAAVSA